MKKATLLAALVAAMALPALGAPIDGVEIGAHKKAAGQTLPLNGAGVRTITLAFIPIKAYVAAFYAPAPLRSAQAVMASAGPLRFDFHFLQGVGQGQVTRAWNAQFQSSATHSYAVLSQDQAKFVGMFGPLKKYGVETVILAGNTTEVIDGGQVKGEVTGRNFQQAFLSLWFGRKPVMDSLKSALLGH